jgi:hypothetical protein
MTVHIYAPLAGFPLNLIEVDFGYVDFAEKAPSL